MPTKLYVSRYGNPELRSGQHTAVRISLGSPKWKLGYKLSGTCKSLMPFGLLNQFKDYERFQQAYFQRLDQIGVKTILEELEYFFVYERDVVLLCFEDIRKPGNWCHRTAFAEWMKLHTGIFLPELHDPSTPKQADSPPLESAIQLSYGGSSI